MSSSENSDKISPCVLYASDIFSDVLPSIPPPRSLKADILFPDNTLRVQAHPRSSERLRHVRSDIGSYNENILSGSARKRRKRDMATDGPISNSKMFVNTPAQLKEDAGKLASSDSSTGTLPGETSKVDEVKKPELDRRRSTRLVMLDKVTGFVEKTWSVLGKRGRDVWENKPQEAENQSRQGEGGNASKACVLFNSEEPMTKRARLSSQDRTANRGPILETGNKVAPKSLPKRWLSHGLYIGQDQDSGLRPNQKSNRLKMSLDHGSKVQRRRFLPMPMFRGHRMIEMGRDFKLPFDVFSPLPPGQPRPEEWKKTYKNVLIGDALSVWKKAKPLESSRCICTSQSGCNEECFNRFMFYECDDSNCNIGADSCTNRGFEQLRQRTKAGGKYNVGIEVIKTLDRGHGVRSNRCFEPNQIIVEYTGEIITQDECDDRMRKHYKDSGCYYLMDFDQQMILDGTRGSVARFVNHSCEPNCKMIKWTVSGIPRMALFAGEKGVMTGEELTYDYNFNPYSVKNVQQCRCGAASCRGILGPKPKEIRDALKPLLAGGKRPFQQAVKAKVQSIVKKHTPAASSVQRTFAAIKGNTNKKLANTHILKSSLARNENLVKKVTMRRPLQRSQKSETNQDSENDIKRVTTITYSRRRRSTAINLADDLYERAANKEAEFQVKAVSVQGTVDRTTRRSARQRFSKDVEAIQVADGS